jgi:hypothetical protein
VEAEAEAAGPENMPLLFPVWFIADVQISVDFS